MSWNAESILAGVLVALCAYLLGCLNGAIIISKYILKDDVRQHGSGNAGLTNFHRVFGGGLTFLVILCDILKAVFAVLIGALVFARFGAPMTGKFIGAAGVLLGHMFPAMFGFKGGKGILSGATVAFMIDWRVGCIVLGLFLILVLLTRYVSVGSIAAGLAFPVASWFFLSHEYILPGAVLGLLIVFMHRANIRRLIKGEENRFSFHKNKEEEQ